MKITEWDCEKFQFVHPEDERKSWYVDEHIVDKFTASVDAALSLAERVLPGTWYLLGKGKTRSDEALYGAQILFGTDEVMGDGEHDGSPAIALIIAILRAHGGSK